MRFRNAKKAAEAERVKGVQVLDKYSALKGLHNDELSDQLKYYKIVEGKKGFRTTGSRAEMVATLQLFIFEKFGASANGEASLAAAPSSYALRATAPRARPCRARGAWRLAGW